MKKKLFLLAALALTAQLASAITFDPNVRYSVKLLDERLAGFNNKNNTVGISTSTCPTWDYVPGLVAKATLEVWDYYKADPELSIKAANWYAGVSYYGKQKYNDTKFVEAADLDILNAAKMYFKLYDGASSDADKTTYKTAMQTAASGINKYVNTSNCKISGPYAKDGWFHKNSYQNQMWCDGQYMGPALLAQLIEYNTMKSDITLSNLLTWDDVVLQLDTAWKYLWNSEDKLLWHVFTTNSTTGGAGGWYNKGNAAQFGTTGVYHSSEAWSRACGWYIMALVDILESMDKVGYTGAGHDRMVAQLQALAEGLAQRQDVNSGCWYQLPKYTNTTSATYADKSTTGSETNSNGGSQANYLEASGSCAFVYGILKGIRLGYINPAATVTNAFNGSDTQTYQQIAVRGYQGIVKTFISNDWQITQSCESAGLSSDRNGTVAYYLIGRDVTINNQTEGKAFGPFLLAAVEYERAVDEARIDPSTCNCLQVTIK